jgi:1-acyl-sn-glycerol-3-phosphate acyltransferase
VKAFDEIRPYQDEEVRAVLRNLLQDPAVVDTVAAFLLPKFHSWLPRLTNTFVRRALTRTTRRLDSVDDVQTFLTGYFSRMIDDTTSGYSVEGIERLDPGTGHLFISNHRDIALDSGFMNFALREAGLATSQIAVGDNLLSQGFATELMRLNKSFVVKRSAGGPKAQYAAMLQTSSYIRATLERGESVWIAQREGRSKDGLDRTEPAIIKMFTLAYRKEIRTVNEWLQRVSLVPVSVSYEVDPCARLKAKELFLTERDGRYDKPVEEDLQSIKQGIVGFKGRVHVSFADSVVGSFEDADSLALHLDRVIVGNLKVFPTHVYAVNEARNNALNQETDGLDKRVREAFQGSLDACTLDQRPYLLSQYANLLKNKEALGV